MIQQGSGVIPALDSGSAHGSPMMGGTGPADAATDTFIRNLAAAITGTFVNVTSGTFPSQPEPAAAPGRRLTAWRPHLPVARRPRRRHSCRRPRGRPP